MRTKNLRIGHACDRAAFEQPLQFAIGQIVGQLPPFPFNNARTFADLPLDTQSGIEDWCSDVITRTQYGYWMTGSSIVDAAEILVRLAEESGNIGPKDD